MLVGLVEELFRNPTNLLDRHSPSFFVTYLSTSPNRCLRVRFTDTERQGGVLAFVDAGPYISSVTYPTASTWAVCVDGYITYLTTSGTLGVVLQST